MISTPASAPAISCATYNPDFFNQGVVNIQDACARNNNGKENTVTVLKTLKPEERSIVNVLDAHGGTYLQKYITKEAGLSRLKTHRLVATLSERGIVQVKKHGKHEPGFAGKMVQ
ncbi:hypothetical protein E6H31_09900 [Candidatus Bathyarchaeota archaeon]|nr:MAG: hypothetical protein E6H31_09900 [Candidatus Bathyarchaeota archaeon]